MFIQYVFIILYILRNTYIYSWLFTYINPFTKDKSTLLKSLLGSRYIENIWRVTNGDLSKNSTPDFCIFTRNGFVMTRLVVWTLQDRNKNYLRSQKRKWPDGVSKWDKYRQNTDSRSSDRDLIARTLLQWPSFTNEGLILGEYMSCNRWWGGSFLVAGFVKELAWRQRVTRCWTRPSDNQRDWMSFPLSLSSN